MDLYIPNPFASSSRQSNDEQLDGQANGQVNGLINGTTNGYVNGQANGHIDERNNGQVSRRVNGQVNGHTNGQVDGHDNGIANGHVNEQANGELGLRPLRAHHIPAYVGRHVDGHFSPEADGQEQESEPYPGAWLPEEAPEGMETALVINVSSGVRE